MKHLFTLIFTLMGLPLGIMAQGWPANYGGVMLQGFYWDSFSDTKWTNLTSQADELSKYFNLIWVPQSGWCNSTTDMGYYPRYWFDQRSAFGTEQELRTMISTFKAKGTGIIADVVVNHKNGVYKWCDFANETVKGKNKTYSVTWDNTGYKQICNNDEANTATKSEAKGKIKGAADTGLGDTGCRDLDHTNATTQQNIKTYEDFLLNEMGYTGFRYDFVKGYDPKYIKMYNEASKPKFSVGEYWHGAVTTTSKEGDHPFGGVKDWVDATDKTSAAFDFPMKYLIKGAFNDGNWKLLDKNLTSTLVGIEPQYAVTFIDNHDTGEPHVNPDPQRANVEAANAYILAMPGTPCIWISHWKPYKYTIKKCILARKIAGVTNTSSIVKSDGQDNGYVLIVKGDKGNVLLLLGSPTYDTTGYQLACEGENFKYYVSSGLDISEINNIKREDTGHVIPSFCTVNDGEVCAFFEQPASSNWKGDITCWAWDKSGNYTGGKWPGSKCKKVGTTSDGKDVWKWTWNRNYVKDESASESTTASLPTGIIFTNKKAGSDSGAQTLNMAFKNGNYYGDNVTYGNATGISVIKANAQTDESWYTIGGTRLSGKPTQKGVYIHQGKKVVVK